jgi:hypothetical protein
LIRINILSIDWVVDTCKQNAIADYTNYCVFKNALNSVKTPKKRVREENTKTIANQSINISMKSYENDLNNYLSQYLTKDSDNQAPVQTTSNNNNNNNNKQNDTEKRSVLQETDLNQIATSMHQQSTTSGNNNSSLQLINAEKAISQKLLLSNKKFTVIGFDVDEISELKTLIESMGGIVNEFDDDDTNQSQENYHLSKPADYFLVPMTITEPLNLPSTATVYWLRKCIEQNIQYPLNEHVLYQPIPRFNTDRALSGCVITISGYVSYEKETISSLCQLVGAVTQSSFSSKMSKDIYPNTHLICKTADGPKYTASKTWKIPAVSIEWLIDSCVSGVKADENKYSIASGNKYEEFIQNLDKIRRNMAFSQQNQTTINEDRSLTTTIVNTDSPLVNDGNETVEFESPKNNNANNSSLLSYSASKKPRLDDQDTPSTTARPSLNGGNLFKTPTADNVFKTPQAVDSRKSIQNKTPGTTTPRLQILKQQAENQASGFSTPENGGSNYGDDPNWQTPLWLKSPNDPKFKDYEHRLNVNVDVDKIMELLRTPNPNGGPPLTPIHEVILRSFKQANENSKIPGFYDYSNNSPEIVYSFEKKKLQRQAAQQLYENQMNHDDEDDEIPATPLDVKEMKEVLKNVKVYVSKKLAKNQAELNNIVETLGGDFIWIYNQSCTHVIYSGKANENNKELRLAKEQNKIIVAPHWLYACQEQKQRVDESQYPYTYNPSKCAVVASRTPKVSLSTVNEKQVIGTPVSLNHQKQASQLPPRSQAKKTTAQNIIKNYCSDEDDDDDENKMNEEDLLASANQANFRLLKKKQAASPQEIENDSEMNLIDSQFMRNCDKQCIAVKNETDIPDSIDIKNDFLNQLQDKLANIRTCGNSSATTTPSTTTTTTAINLNTSQLNEHQIMNELNKSGRSKWGNSISNDFEDRKSGDGKDDADDLFSVRISDDTNSSCLQLNECDDSDIEKLRQLNINRKAQPKYGFNNKNDVKKRRQFSKAAADEEDDDNTTISHNVAPSQIQVTVWKEEEHQTVRRKNENISDRLTSYYKI